MSRYECVIKETDRVLTKDKEKYGSLVMTNLFLYQISNTLAMIYDDGFAPQIILKTKEPADEECERRTE